MRFIGYIVIEVSFKMSGVGYWKVIKVDGFMEIDFGFVFCLGVIDFVG